MIILFKTIRLEENDCPKSGAENDTAEQDLVMLFRALKAPLETEEIFFFYTLYSLLQQSN